MSTRVTTLVFYSKEISSFNVTVKYGAVDMARDILEYTDYEEIRTMAQNIIDVQEKEIAQMKKIVKEQQESQQE